MTPNVAWETIGITKHFGGISATNAMLSTCKLKPGDKVLEIGCGTGYTSCMLAKRFNAMVTAVDISGKLLQAARKRAKSQGIYGIRFIRADVCKLPFKSNSFDFVIAESVLSLTDASQAASEIYRVLKGKGTFCDNEVTYIHKPSEEEKRYFATSLGTNVTILLAKEWKHLFRKAGFTRVHAESFKLNTLEDFRSHLAIDGFWKTISGFGMIFEKRFRSTYLNASLLKQWMRFFRFAGYGIYACKKYGRHSKKLR